MYTLLTIDGKGIRKHRLNFEITMGRAIGPGMDVDHIVTPPKHTDGSKRPTQDDSWKNLQELPRTKHNRKTQADNPQAGKKRGATQGFPVIARHVETGGEIRYESITDAAKTLKISRWSICSQIQRGSARALLPVSPKVSPLKRNGGNKKSNKWQ
jgi:hypothetical protein